MYKFVIVIGNYRYVVGSRLGSNTTQKYLITNTNTDTAQNNKYKHRSQLRILNTITNTEHVFQLQLQILSARV